MDEPVLRPAHADDLDAVLALLAAAQLPLDGVAESLGDFVVAVAEGCITAAGGLEVRGDSALLRSVVVAPDQRGTGLGTRVTRWLLAEADRRRLESLWLLTTTAAEFFTRHGFRVASREDAPAALRQTAEFTGACPASATVMSRNAPRLRVAVLCTANIARSQIAEALLAHHGGPGVVSASAGARPGNGPHPLAIDVLRRRGIDWSARRSKAVDAIADRQWDVVITVCDDARDACPLLPGARQVHWSIRDPARGGIEDFEAVAADLDGRIREFLRTALAAE